MLASSLPPSVTDHRIFHSHIQRWNVPIVRSLPPAVTYSKLRLLTVSTVIFSIILAVALAASSNFGFISASNRCISFTSVSALASFSRPVQNDQPATTRNEIPLLAKKRLRTFASSCFKNFFLPSFLRYRGAKIGGASALSPNIRTSRPTYRVVSMPDPDRSYYAQIEILMKLANDSVRNSNSTEKRRNVDASSNGKPRGICK